MTARDLNQIVSLSDYSSGINYLTTHQTYVAQPQEGANQSRPFSSALVLQVCHFTPVSNSIFIMLLFGRWLDTSHDESLGAPVDQLVLKK